MANSEPIHVKNDELTKAIKNIIGEDMVKCVYDQYYDNQNYETLNKRNQLNRYNFTESNFLEYDTYTIVIEFTNGNLVEFRNSEWAAMTKIFNLNVKK
jgi:hypothetical protein